MQEIIIKGAREHNLKDIDLSIPRERLVVITGISGSGKSSLAFDTIYAEGQRRYVESLSVYARQFLDQMDKPDVESIEGLSPAISIEQKTTSRNPRSTVGTVTEVYDYLRLLYARVGRPHCYKCGRAITSQSIEQMVERIMGLKEATRIEIHAPIVRGRKGEYKKELLKLRREGYTKAVIDSKQYDLSEEIKLDKKKKHYIDVVIDRLIIKGSVVRRLADSLEVASALASGMVKVLIHARSKKAKPDPKIAETLLFNEQLSCLNCSISYEEITHAFFSFNSPHGACDECKGLGEKFYFDPELVIPDKKLSLGEGAVAPWSKRGAYYRQILTSLGAHEGFDMDTPFYKLPVKVRDLILNGSGGDEIEFEYKKEKRHYIFKETFEGVLKNLDRRYRETESADVRFELESYMNVQPCPQCLGARLKAQALSVKIDKRSIWDVVRLSIKEALVFFKGLKFTKNEEIIAGRILKEIDERLGFLVKVGLDYISLDRAASTLSGGEGQRIRLATQIGSGLVGVLYILDEPSIGLHQRDNQKLLSALKRLRDMGNSVLVVEHDEETIREADFIIDMGPGAGEHGGQVVATGTAGDIMKNKKSITGRYLSGALKIELPKQRLKARQNYLSIKGASANNLKNINVKFPLGLMTCVSGVSGSGKSTLVVETLYKNLAKRLYRSKVRPGAIKSIEGVEFVDKVIDIDQSPIGRTPRSNPATYTGLFTHIRDLYSQLPDAQLRGFGPGRFSFNVKGGRCETCRGEGVIKVEMHFLPDVYVHCDQCSAKRYNRDTLEISYRGKNISDCLALTVTEALEFFKNIPHIRNKLQTLFDVGLGYIRLGQSAITLSGGEAQRIKLTRELSKRATGRTIYILDEPTTGLHFADISKLIDVLKSLRDNGNTIVIIEHNLDVIKCADFVIDLGPEGGERGGEVVVKGSPEEISACKTSFTGLYLKKLLKAEREPGKG